MTHLIQMQLKPGDHFADLQRRGLLLRTARHVFTLISRGVTPPSSNQISTRVYSRFIAFVKASTAELLKLICVKF